MDTHHQLQVWQHARRLVTVVYRLTKELPPVERFVAVSQLRRAVWSVQNNIAEGKAKLGRPEMRRLFDVAIGSLAEVDAMLTTLGDLYPLDPVLIAEASNLRQSINGRLFAMLRTRRR
jgi:four helix bundle protein